MTDPNETLPPRKPRTIRTALAWLMAQAEAHPVWAAAGCGFVAGWLLPKLAAWLLG